MTTELSKLIRWKIIEKEGKQRTFFLYSRVWNTEQIAMIEREIGHSNFTNSISGYIDDTTNRLMGVPEEDKPPPIIDNQYDFVGKHK